MTGPSESVAGNVTRLKDAFTRATTARSLGGAAILEELAGLARECVANAAPEPKAVAFALARLFDAVARDRAERPVSIEEDAALSIPTLSRAVAFLEKPGTAKDALDVIAALADIDRRLVP